MLNITFGHFEIAPQLTRLVTSYYKRFSQVSGLMITAKSEGMKGISANSRKLSRALSNDASMNGAMIYAKGIFGQLADKE